jgi:hypothetical protein
MSQGYPSENPSRGGGLAGVIGTVLEKFLQGVDGMLPAEIVSYDRKGNTAAVRPLVAVRTTDGATLSRAVVASVPVLAVGGGNFTVNFPLKPGDKGWIKANDRDISLYMQGMREAEANTRRLHSFEDGLFIPDVLRKYTLDGEDFDADMVIQKLDGTVRVALWPDRVKTTCGDTWLEVNKDGSITGDAPVKITLAAPLIELRADAYTMRGHGAGRAVATMDCDIEQTGRHTSTEDQIAGTISQMDHIHSGVTPGGGNTAEPVE